MSLERKNKDIILGSAYLGPVSYFTQLYSCNKAYIERYDHYVKQTYRNRCVIASADGPLSLTVPIEKTGDAGGKCAMKDIRISEHGNWRHVHRNAFVAAYKQSPFFDYYMDEFNAFFEKKYEFLYDFNLDLTRWLCEQIDIQPEIIPTMEYMQEDNKEYEMTAAGTGRFGLADYRELIHPKRRTEEMSAFFKPVSYYQVFDSRLGFIPDLSIIDLLFNMGPESLLVLRDCNK